MFKKELQDKYKIEYPENYNEEIEKLKNILIESYKDGMTKYIIHCHDFEISIKIINNWLNENGFKTYTFVHEWFGMSIEIDLI